MLFVEGYTCSGKSTISEYLISKGFVHIGFGPDIIGKIHARSGSNLSLIDWAFNHTKRHGKTFLYQAIVEVLRSKRQEIGPSSENIVLSGCRSDTLITHLRFVVVKEAYSPIIFLDVPKRELLRRYLSRHRDGENREDFSKKIRNERILGIERTRAMSEFKINSTERNVVFSEVDKVVQHYWKKIRTKQ